MITPQLTLASIVAPHPGMGPNLSMEALETGSRSLSDLHPLPRSRTIERLDILFNDKLITRSLTRR